MAANQYGIDLGEIYRTKAAVEGSRTQNKLSGLKLGEMEREIAERPVKEAAANERKNLLAQNIQSAIGGDAGALGKLYALDIDTAKTVADRVDKMSEKEKEQAKANRLEMAQMSVWIADAPTPEEAASNFQVVMSKMPPETQEKMQSELDQFGGDAKKYAMYSLARVKDIGKIFSNPQVVQVAGDDVVYKAGREVERKARPVKTSGTGSDGGGVKSADESLMYRQAAERMGGMFDDAGNLTAIDPTVRPKVQAIATRASEIFKQGGVTRSRAVSMAHDEVVGADNDPLKIR